MMYLPTVVPFNSDRGYSCEVCCKHIGVVIGKDDKGKPKQYEPESKYWNEEREQAYCSAKCSLGVTERVQHGSG